jgi:hypothetical protein
MPERINGGFALAAIGALVLFISLFLNWFEPGFDAWTVFEIEDLLLAALALFTLYAVAGNLRSSARPPAISEASIRYAGLAALTLVVATLIQHPPAFVHRSPQSGAWLALLGAAMITVGGFVLRGRLSIVVTLSPRDRTSTVRVAGRPEGTMPAPPPAEEAEYEGDENEAVYDTEAEYESEEELEASRTETQPIRDQRQR